MTGTLWDEDDGAEWVTIEVCARRMAISQERVLQLVKQRALRTRSQYGFTLVRPAIVSGAVN